MSVENHEISEHPRTILPGDKVLIFKSSYFEYFHDGLFSDVEFSNNGPISESLTEVFQGIVKTSPEQFSDHRGFWEIKGVECINHMGALTKCVDLIIDSDDMSFSITRIASEQPANQYGLRLDPEGALQL